MSLDYLGPLLGGLACLAYGCYTLYLWIVGKTEKFSKLEAMKKLYGEKTGKIVHLIGYVIIPLVAGIVITAFSVLHMIFI